MLLRLGLQACCLGVFLFGVTSAVGQTTEFTYQGSLKDGASLASGNYDFEFALFDQLSSGTQLGMTLTRSSVAVASGVFAVKLDFGDQFPGAARFLEVRVRLAGQPLLTTLSPRQALNSAPHAIKSLNAQNAVNSLSLGGVAAAQFVLTGDARLSDARNPLANSPNYIQNTASPQAASNFNISGNGSAATFNAVTQYNIAGSRVLSVAGAQNTIAGLSSGSVNTGANNSFYGWQSGTANSSANNNSFFGAGTGRAATTGGSNSFFGSFTGDKNTVGAVNAFFGSSAGTSNIDGSGNSFFGNFAGQGNTSGGTNSYFGLRAGEVGSTASENAFFGDHTGVANTTGFRNTLLGSSANVGGPNLSNATAVGANAVVAASNSLVLGNMTKVGIGTSAPIYKLHVIDPSNNGFRVETATVGGTIASFGGSGAFRVDAPGIIGGRLTILENGNVGINATNPADRLAVGGTLAIQTLGIGGATGPLCLNTFSQITICSSSRRYKSNIGAYSTGLGLISKLSPITFDWKAGGAHDLGLGAEDVAAIEPLLVTHNADGEIEGVKYDRIGVVLINAVKEQQFQIAAQERKIEAQERQLKDQRAEIDALKALVCLQNKDAGICREAK